MLVFAPALVRAEPEPDDAPRRRGFDIEAHVGIVGSIMCDTCDVNLGRTAGGAILYRALPHLAVGLAGDAIVFPVVGSPRFPTVTMVTGVIGPTVRGYFVGRGAVDAFVGLTVGGMPLSQSPAASGVGIAGLVAFDQVLGAEIALTRRLRFSPAVAATFLVGAESGSDNLLTRAGPPDGGLPELTLSLRLGWTFAIVR
jgi:hypothetical protein